MALAALIQLMPTQKDIFLFRLSQNALIKSLPIIYNSSYIDR